MKYRNFDKKGYFCRKRFFFLVLYSRLVRRPLSYLTKTTPLLFGFIMIPVSMMVFSCRAIVANRLFNLTVVMSIPPLDHLQGIHPLPARCSPGFPSACAISVSLILTTSASWSAGVLNHFCSENSV